MDTREQIFLVLYFPLVWVLEICHGMMNTVIGPSQLYLARNVGIGVEQINFLWTFGFLGFLVGSFATGAIVKPKLKKPWQKVSLLGAVGFISGALMIVLPFTTSPIVLFASRTVQFAALGSLTTADTILLVYMLGVVRSRPYIMALHAVIGVGFLTATFLVKPFLPSKKGSVCTDDESRFANISNGTTLPVNNESSIAELEGAEADMIHWPFVIVGTLAMVTSFLFIPLLLLPLKMPIVQEEEPSGGMNKSEKAESLKICEVQAEATSSDSRSESSNISSLKRWLNLQSLLLVIIFLYYFNTCGIERIFQPMLYSFGLCGPLQLSPSQAVLSDSCYNGGFMSGRILSIFMAKYIQPVQLITLSLSACAVTSAILCVVSRFSMYGLYLATFSCGFFLAWQFGSCVNWTASKIDITGKISSLFFVGCGIGGMVNPIISGYLFSSDIGPMAVMYLTFVCSLAQCVIFGLASVVARKFQQSNKPELTKEASC